MAWLLNLLAEIAAKLWEKTRRHGLSLADRACLALAIDQNHAVLTADRAWSKLGLGVEDPIDSLSGMVRQGRTLRLFTIHLR
ncbi:MAG: hypothetical protein KZQ76_06960 [Candidatus Thiodiazotropha sp. (ex Epidulcina cf. delphinae)]|nr:hypothetical protein [Candidatus Thiodiazotropha sp. (ex Epidulcina cf. delphinae)]